MPAPRCVSASTRTSARTRSRSIGFLTQDEKAMFEKLIAVSGIGPKLAITMLSGLAAPDLIRCDSARRG